LTEVSVETGPSHFASIAAAASVGARTPDGQLLTVGDAKAAARLHALNPAGQGRAIGPVLTHAHPLTEQINFSPQPKYCANTKAGQAARQQHT
jgi:hypothetical protein